MLFQPSFNKAGATNRYTFAGKTGQTQTLADSLKTTPKPQDLITSTTQELIRALNTNSDMRTTLAIIQKQFDTMETYCHGLPPGTAKTAVTTALRTAHKDFATALLAEPQLSGQPWPHLSSAHSHTPTSTLSLSRSSSGSSSNGSFSHSFETTISEQMAANLPFFTQSLVGRMAVAMHLANQATEPIIHLPSTLYMPDMAGAQKDPAFATSLALYPQGLLAAAKNKDLSKADTALDMPTTLDILQTFELPTSTSTSPIDRAETYAPFVDTHTQELLNGTLDPQILLDHPALETAIKQALPAKLTPQLATTGYVQNLLKDTQWETQFSGFETELFTGLCQALDPNKTPDMQLLTLTMSVAEALNTPDVYDTVINKLSDAQLEHLFSPQTPSQITAMLQHNKAWQSALGKRLDILEIAEQKQQLHAVLNQEIKLNEAKPFVKTQQRAHVGYHTDLHISPRLMIPILTANPVDKGHAQSAFAKAVDSFCANPTASNAPNINTLYQQAKDLVAQKDSLPAPLQMRITLILGIHENLKTPVANTGENLGNKAWEYKAPIEIKTSAKSSHQQALKSLQNGSKSDAKPKTLHAWVQFFQKDADAKVAKYTARRDTATGNAKNLYTDLVANSEKFGKTMDQVDKELTARDILAVRNTLQTAMATTATALTALEAKVDTSKEGKAALKTHKEVLTEMIQVYRRLDHGIANSIAKTHPPVSTPTFAKVPTNITHAAPTSKPVAATLITELAPSLRTYEAGMSATKAPDIDTPIKALKAAIAASQQRVNTEESNLAGLRAAVSKLLTQEAELGELHTLVETTIPAALADRDRARTALGDNPLDGTRPTQPGLYQNLFDAQAEHTRLGQETAERRRELVPLEQAVTRLRDVDLSDAEERIRTTTETRDRTQQQIEALDTENHTLTQENIRLNADIATLPGEIATLRAQLASKELLTDLNTQSATLNARLLELGQEISAENAPAPDEDEHNPLIARAAHRLQAIIDQEIENTNHQLEQINERITTFALPLGIADQARLLGLDDAELPILEESLLTQTQTRDANLLRIAAIPGEIDALRIRFNAEDQAVTRETTARDLLRDTTIPNAEMAVRNKGVQITQAEQAEAAQRVICQNIEANIQTEEGFITDYNDLVTERNAKATTLGFSPDAPGGDTYDTLTAGAIDTKRQETTRDLTAETQKRNIQQSKYDATKKKEEGETGTIGIQDHLRTRILDLTKRKTELRKQEEAGSFLGEQNTSRGDTYGDALDRILVFPYQTHLATIRDDILNGRYGDALTKLKDPSLSSLSSDLEPIIDALQTYATDKSALKTHAAPLTLTQKASRFAPLKSSSQQQALKATGGSVKTLEDHLTFAEKHAAARLAKTSSHGPTLNPIITSYADCLKGANGTPSLKTLLMNGDAQSRQTAIERLQTTISDINLSFSSQDAKDIRIKDEIISSLNTLKTEIEKATSTVATPRKQVLASQLRAALTAMSDVPAPVAASSTGGAAPTPKTPVDFYMTPSPSSASTTLVASPTAASRIPTAKATLEKRGLYHNPKATWDSYTPAQKHLFFAHVYANAAIKTALTASNTILDFKAAILALNEIDKAPLQALYDLATQLNDTAHADYTTRVQTFQTIYKEINAVTSSSPNDLKNLHAHTTAIAKWMNDTSATIPQDPTQQALLLEVGLLVNPSNTAVTAESDASLARLYRHRPLTDSLISDLSIAATAYGDTPEFIGCMGDALGQALRIPASDTRLSGLTAGAKAWSETLQHLSWTPDSEKRLQHSIRTYQQANELYIRLQAENKTSPETTAMATTLQHLYADIQQGVAAIKINNKITTTTPADLTEKLQLVSQIRIPTAASASTQTQVPTRRARLHTGDSAFTASIKALPVDGSTPITRLLSTGPNVTLKIDSGAPQTLTAYHSDAPANSPNNALQALFGKPSAETIATTDGNLSLLSCRVEDSELNSKIGTCAAKPVSTEAAGFFRERLHLIAKETGNQAPPNIRADNATLKASLQQTTDISADVLQWFNDMTGSLATPNLDTLAPAFIKHITEDPNRPMHSLELLFVSEMMGEPVAVLEPGQNDTYIYRRSCPTATVPPKLIEYRHGEYARLATPEDMVATRSHRPIPLAFPSRTHTVQPGTTFGVTFGEKASDTNITCWLEAAIYSAAYDPQKTLLSKLDQAIKNPGTFSLEKVDFLTKYHAFLTAASDPGATHVPGIAALNQEAQALYFGTNAIEQQDPTEFLRRLHADLDTILQSSRPSQYTRTETLTVQNTAPVRDPNTETVYTLYNTQVALTNKRSENGTPENKSTYSPLAIALGGDTPTGTLQAVINVESGSDSLRKDDGGNVTQTVVTKRDIAYAAANVENLPDECHITVSRAYDKTTHSLRKAPLLSPETGGTQQYVSISADIDGTLTDVRYNISQIIAHSGYVGGGHYVCYFQPNPGEDTWYKKSSNGNAATKLGDYAAVSAELGKGDLTYTYMGVRA